jgi:pimeloyl-ACP methyl ester carboxylesterase
MVAVEATLDALRARIGTVGQGEVLLEYLHTLTMPTLVWGGTRQGLPRTPNQRRARQARAGSLTLVPDCGHLPQIEHPDRFADTLARFLDEMEPFRDGMKNPANTPRKEER